MTKPDAAARASARRTIETEAEALHELARAIDGPLGDPFARAVALIAGAKGPEQVAQNVQAAKLVANEKLWQIAASHGGTPR